MNAVKWIGTVAAVGAITIASSRASAVICYSPGLSLPDVIANGQTPIGAALDCRSTSNSGVTLRAKAEAFRGSTFVRVNLREGDYARVSGFNANRQAIANCFAEDFTPVIGPSGVTTCSSTVAFIDLTTQNL